MADKRIKLGLSMSGAISAGAYTAGVFDFLVESLDQWDRHRGEPGVPSHRVTIPALAGSSAGAVTAALGILAAVRGPVPMEPGAFPCTLPELYDAWVVQPDLARATDCGALLDGADLVDEDSPLASLLDSTVLERIGHRAVDGAARTEAAEGARAPTYLNDKIHLFMTMTNLRGVPYRVPFDGDPRGYVMMSHADRAHYTLLTGGEGAFRSPWAARDAAVPLDARTRDTAGPEWATYIRHALASAAFPFGLSARVGTLTYGQYEHRAWPLPIDPERAEGIRPAWPQPPVMTDPLPFAAVDGGMLDNDPFQYIRYTLMEDPPRENPDTTREASRILVMISPFPEGPVFERNDAAASRTSLARIIGRFLPTFMENARFKPAELADALDPEHADRWMIVPRRVDDTGQASRYALACGGFQGFGGFFDRSFREHDYQLGRRNAQRFLSAWFGVDPDNPNVDPAVRMPDTGGAALVPLLGTAARPVPLPPWPRLAMEAIPPLVDKAQQRGDLVTRRLAFEARGMIGVAIRLLWWRERSAAGQALYWLVLAGLIERDQLAHPAIERLDDDARGVLAACYDLSFDFRTPTGIARDRQLEPDAVTGIFRTLVAAKLVTAVEDFGGAATVFAAAMRVPTRFNPNRSPVSRWLAVLGDGARWTGRRCAYLLTGVPPGPLYRVG